MRKQGRGKISQKISIGSKVITPINTTTFIGNSTEMHYFATSKSTYINTGDKTFLPINLSNITNVLKNKQVQPVGNTIFNSILTTPTIFLKFKGNESEEDLPISINEYNNMLYVDNGRSYVVKGAKSENKNFTSNYGKNTILYNNIKRSDIDGFDFPQFRITNTRKIPSKSGDTFCGPYQYSGYTYNRSNYNWNFGYGGGINFNPIKTGGTPTIYNSLINSQEGCSSISNNNGDLLFYTDGNTVYTSGNTIMFNGENLSSSGTSTQSSLIVPKINSKQYYIFTTDYYGNTNGFEYSIVDYTLNSEGSVINKNNVLISNPVTEKVTACETHSNDGYWIITHTSGDSKFYSFKLSSNGLSSPVISDVGSIHNTTRGYMKISLDGEKIVSLLYDENKIDIGDFDNSSGVISNIKTLSDIEFNNGPYGLEFSSDSSKIYISDGASTQIYQFNLDVNSEEEIKEKRIKLPTINDSSLGALQMGVDERIYVADINNNNLHVINNPNGLGVECNLQINNFSLSSSTINNITSSWGLPNFITSNNLSPDRFVFVCNSENIEFDVVINNINKVIESKNLTLLGEIYKFNENNSAFTNNSIYDFTITNEELVKDNTNKIKVPTRSIGEGEFIIKGYYNYNINTLIAKQKGLRKNSTNSYKRGYEYNLYNSSTDWYFLYIKEANTPIFINEEVPATPVKTEELFVQTIFTSSSTNRYTLPSTKDTLVSLNGSILTKDLDYSATTQSGGTRIIDLKYLPEDGEQLTFVFMKSEDSSVELFNDSFIVDTIESGTTNNYNEIERVFYNIETQKYEFYLTSPSNGDVIMTLNGNILSKDIDYLLSTSNSKRIILLKDIEKDDLIEAFYRPVVSSVGVIKTNKPTISWRINDFPINTKGKFIVEFTDVNDEKFENIISSFETPYIINQKNYSIVIELTNVTVGEKFLYRVKNEKFYNPIKGETIYSFNYSDVIKIEIGTNSGENY